MIFEHALLPVKPEDREAFEAAMREAVPQIAASPGFLGIEVRPPADDGGCYLLLVRWASIADHRDGFRQSERYQHWRSLLHPFYARLPEVSYFEDRLITHV